MFLQIKVKSGIPAVSYTTIGLRFADGQEVQADVIVFGTGWRNNLKQTVTETVGKDIGDQLDDYSGTTAEGEIRGLAVPIGRKLMLSSIDLYC